MSHLDGTDFLKDLRKLKADLHKDVHDAMQDAMQEAEKEAKATRLYNNVTGVLRNKTKGIVTSSTTGELRADTSYAHYVENGTRRHTIIGNPYLQFQWKGERVAFRWVDHPGTAPRPFMKEAAEWGEYVLHTQLENFTANSINRFNT